MNCPWCDQAGSPVNGFCPQCENEWITAFQIDHEAETEMLCPRCTQQMKFVGEEKLQRSSMVSNLFLGELGDLFKGTLNLNTYLCLTCFKVEFELSESDRIMLREVIHSIKE